jgi:hypothetical protein
VVAAQSTHGSSLGDLAPWAAEQIEAFPGLRGQLPGGEMSLLFEPEDARPAHGFLQSIGDHVLVVMFTERACVGSVREVTLKAIPTLRRQLDD